MIAQVRFLYSDSPSEGFLRYLPNLLGCAEDFLHLVFRLEACTGKRRTACTSEVLRLQLKFDNAFDIDTMVAVAWDE